MRLVSSSVAVRLRFGARALALSPFVSACVSDKAGNVHSGSVVCVTTIQCPRLTASWAFPLHGRGLCLARWTSGRRENFRAAVPLHEARVAALAAAVNDAGRVVAHDAVGAALIASEGMVLTGRGYDVPRVLRRSGSEDVPLHSQRKRRLRQARLSSGLLSAG